MVLSKDHEGRMVSQIRAYENRTWVDPKGISRRDPLPPTPTSTKTYDELHQESVFDAFPRKSMGSLAVRVTTVFKDISPDVDVLFIGAL